MSLQDLYTSAACRQVSSCGLPAHLIITLLTKLLGNLFYSRSGAQQAERQGNSGGIATKMHMRLNRGTLVVDRLLQKPSCDFRTNTIPFVFGGELMSGSGLWGKV